MARKKIEAIAYLRTSSPTNASKGLSADKDSDKRQRAAIIGFAAANGYTLVDEFYDVVSGSDPIDQRTGFKAMLDRIAGNGVRVILVESPDRFARDLAVQLAGHDYLRKLGVELVPASAPDFFLADTPTAVLVRQVLGAISQFEKTSLVAKLKAATASAQREAGPKAASRIRRSAPRSWCWRSNSIGVGCPFGGCGRIVQTRPHQQERQTVLAAVGPEHAELSIMLNSLPVSVLRITGTPGIGAMLPT